MHSHSTGVVRFVRLCIATCTIRHVFTWTDILLNTLSIFMVHCKKLLTDRSRRQN